MRVRKPAAGVGSWAVRVGSRGIDSTQRAGTLSVRLLAVRLLAVRLLAVAPREGEAGRRGPEAVEAAALMELAGYAQRQGV